MTPKQLQEGARLLAAATPGPWQVRSWPDGRPNILEGNLVLDGENWYGEWIATFPELVPEARERQRNSAAAIAWLRTHAAELIADAARYQWLRTNPTYMGWEHDFAPERCDAEIDRVMAAARASGTEGACS